MNATAIKDLKKGDFFTKRSIDEPREDQVWVCGDYDRSSRRYECCRFDDVNTTCFLIGGRQVFTDFTF